MNCLTQEIFAELVQLFDALVASQHLPILPNLLETSEHAHLRAKWKVKNMLTITLHYLLIGI